MNYRLDHPRLRRLCTLSFEMEMPIHFVAPAFGFQKIFLIQIIKLRKMIKQFGKFRKVWVSIGFHSGSNKQKIINWGK